MESGNVVKDSKTENHKKKTFGQISQQQNCKQTAGFKVAACLEVLIYIAYAGASLQRTSLVGASCVFQIWLNQILVYTVRRMFDFFSNNF